MTALSMLNIAQLDNDMTNDPDNLDLVQSWYLRLVELEVEGDEPFDVLDVVFRGMKWVMQAEHTVCEELRDEADRFAVEAAESSELFEQEREMYKEEVSNLRERITSQAGVDSTAEAFRAEIDSLNAETALLKQFGRERDRELADARDKLEQLTDKLGQNERERNAWINTQLQLEDTIRDLNRRLSAKSEEAPRGEWESRKLKLRSEQALQLGGQLRNADAQNAQLKDRVEHLAQALEEATALLNETTKKYENLREQLAVSAVNAARLVEANRDLHQTLAARDELLGDREQTASVSAGRMEEVVRDKDVQLQHLSALVQRYEAELEEAHVQLQAVPSNSARETELEKLRLELVAATQLAQRLFGGALSPRGVAAADGDGALGELRVRLVQLSRELEVSRAATVDVETERTRLERLLETKDASAGDLHAENERLRKLAFGDTADHVRQLERQIEYRDCQIERLTMRCSILQLELEGNTSLTTSRAQPTPKRQKQEADDESSSRQAPAQRLSTAKRRPKTRRTQSVAPSVEPSIVQTGETAGGSSSESSSKSSNRKTRSPKTRTQIVQTPPTFTALQLLRLLDDGETADEWIDHDRLLRSLLVEFRRLSDQLADRDSRLEEARSRLEHLDTTSQDEVKAARETRDRYEQLRRDLLDGHDEEEETSSLRSRLEEARIANAELERLIESLRLGREGASDGELERRYEETTRRLVHVAIQLHGHERRVMAMTRRQRLLVEELASTRDRLTQLLAGDDRRARALTRENEQLMITTARLQNVLIQSVPARVYERLLADFKRLLRRQTPGATSGDDAGYESGSAELDAQLFDITLTAHDETTAPRLADDNRRLRNENLVLERQNEHWKAETSRHAAEAAELRSFLDDVEQQSDLKAMIVSIEHRFLAALREHIETTTSQRATLADTQRLRRELASTRHRWRQDRDRLVDVIATLQMSVRRTRASTAPPLTVAQLLVLRTAADEQRDTERRLADETATLDARRRELEQQQALTEAARESYEATTGDHFEAQSTQLALQRLQFNAKMLANQLRDAHQDVDRLRTAIAEREQQLADARRELDERDLVVNLRVPSPPPSLDESRNDERAATTTTAAADDDETQRVSPQPSLPPPQPQPPPLRRLSSTSSTSDGSEERVERRPPSSPPLPPTVGPLVIESGGGDEQQTAAIKAAAQLAINGYKEQLEHKERALDEYKRLLATMQAAVGSRPTSIISMAAPLVTPVPINQLLADNDTHETLERQLIALRLQLEDVETANARLADQIAQHQSAPVVSRVSIAVQTTDMPADGNGPPATAAIEMPSDDERVTTPSGDSGTVRDLSSADDSDNDAAARPPIPHSKLASTRILDEAVVAASIAETQLLRHRGEVRRLRERLAGLERRNRDLTVECESLRARTRHVRDVNPESEAALLRRDNERLRREARGAVERARTQSARADAAETALERRTRSMRERADGWREQKNVESELTAARERLGVADTRRQELEERLERRDRLIERLSRGVGADADAVRRLRRDLDVARANETTQQNAATALQRERALLDERLRVETARADAALQQTPVEWRSAPTSSMIATVAITSPPSSALHTLPSPVKTSTSSNKSHIKVPTLPGTVSSTSSIQPPDHLELQRRLRLAEMRAIEASEQADEARDAYTRLQHDYVAFRRLRDSNSTQSSAAVVLLEDKLRAKQREVDQLRVRCEQYEDHIEATRLGRLT